MAHHTCHAHNCPIRVPPSMFMCRAHWWSLDKRLRDAIWREYRPGQEIDKYPSLRYYAVQQHAIGTLAFQPNDEAAAREAAPYLMRSVFARQQCIKDGVGDPLSWVILPTEDGT